MKSKLAYSLALALTLPAAAAQAQDSLRAFGLEFSVISNAVMSLDTGYAALKVEQINPPDCYPSSTNEVTVTNYPFGVSVHLGEAQSGVYIYPNDAGCRGDGMSMWGDAYGSVNGQTNRLISSIKGTRVSWGYYSIKADLTPLGATSYTYQVWSHGTKMMHVTNNGPCSFISTYNMEDRDPRVNPFYLTEAGPAALIEFPYGTQFQLADNHTSIGDRIIIIAEGATNHVDYVSRVDVFGNETLPAFGINTARIGMFGYPHAALGDANFIASGGRLTTERSQNTNSFGSGTGVLVDFKNPVMRWHARTEPFALEETNAQFMLSATGLRSIEDPYTPQYFGPAGFTRTNGALNLSADFTYLRTSNSVLRVFNGDSLSGTILGPNGSTLATLTETNPMLTGWSAGLETFSFSIAQSTRVTGYDGTLLEGDRFEFVPHQNEMHIGQLYDANVVAQGTPRYTIISESTEEAPVPELRMRIDRTPVDLLISWPYRASFSVDIRSNLTSFGFVYDGPFPTQYRDFNWYMSVSPTNDMRVYSLRHYYYYYFNP
ncbi:MAG TPA: hypothetical protein VK850_16210 [Candidatus Binatia bacterium]|nr:hypothetical protein [Candidatus Binatia bacterium]